MFGLADHFWLASNSRSGKMLSRHLRSSITMSGCVAPKRQFPQQPANFNGHAQLRWRASTLATASEKYYTPDGKLITPRPGRCSNARYGASAVMAGVFVRWRSVRCRSPFRGHAAVARGELRRMDPRRSASAFVYLAKTSRPTRYAAAQLIPRSHDRGKADPIGLHRRHRLEGRDEPARTGQSDNR
jgi:hypothetical protein